ncbi:MAG: hypothetical protein ACI9VT_001131 [Psychroserpens sp.]|jgi:hypothetical protein
MQAVVELIDKDTTDAILSEGAKLTASVIAPLNRNSDEQGTTWSNGKVTTPDGFIKRINFIVKAVLLDRYALYFKRCEFIGY